MNLYARIPVWESSASVENQRMQSKRKENSDGILQEHGVGYKEPCSRCQ